MRLSRLLMLPFAIIGGYILYQLLVNDQYQYSYYLIIPVIAITACLALYPQLDALGYKWWPLKADPKLKAIIEHSSPSIQWIPQEEREAFFANLYNKSRAVDYIGMKVEDIPTDIKIMSIYPAALMEYIFGIDLLKEYNRVVFYKHPFPSPQYRKWHSAEVNHEDGVMLYSLEQMIMCYSRPGEFYHIAFDPWIRALLKSHPELAGIDLMNHEVHWSSNDLDHSKALKLLGLDNILNRHLNWQAFLHHSEIFKQLHTKAWLQIQPHLVAKVRTTPIIALES